MGGIELNSTWNIWLIECVLFIEIVHCSKKDWLRNRYQMINPEAPINFLKQWHTNEIENISIELNYILELEFFIYPNFKRMCDLFSKFD